MTSIIPAIDLIGGKCVRLTKGDYNSEKVYNDDPVSVAVEFQDKGAKDLHIVDLDAAGGNINAHHELIRDIIQNTNLNIQIGGGIRKKEQIESLLKIGAKKVIVGSKAQTDKEEVVNWIADFGREHIIIGADVSGMMISTHGWKRTSDDNIYDYVDFYIKNGAYEFLCTDIAKDGMMEGPSLTLYKALMQKFSDSIFIASGGVTTESDIESLISIGMNRIIVGKAIYEERLDLETIIKMFMTC